MNTNLVPYLSDKEGSTKYQELGCGSSRIACYWLFGLIYQNVHLGAKIDMVQHTLTTEGGRKSMNLVVAMKQIPDLQQIRFSNRRPVSGCS